MHQRLPITLAKITGCNTLKKITKRDYKNYLCFVSS